jgi:beta-galactosidase
VTCGVNIFFNFLSSIGLGVYSDEKAKKDAEAAGKKPAEKQEKKKAVGSEFYNMLSLLMGDWFMKAGATLPPCTLAWPIPTTRCSLSVYGSHRTAP